jgi:hypothetical protein
MFDFRSLQSVTEITSRAFLVLVSNTQVPHPWLPDCVCLPRT